MNKMMAWIAACLLACWSIATADVCIPEYAGGAQFRVGANFGTSALGDFNGDGHLDLTIGLRFFLGDGAGGFSEAAELEAPIGVAFDIRYADFDQDGQRDFAMVEFGAEQMIFFYGREPSGVAADLFEDAVALDFSRVAVGIWHIELGDMNNDGLMDLVGISIGGRNLLILLNNGARRFTPKGHSQGVQINHMLATGDFDNDGNVDIATGRGSEISLFFGNGDGTLGREITGVLRRGARVLDGHRFRAADIDRDGRSDLFATAGTSLLVFLGRDIDRVSGFPPTASLALDISGVARFLEIADMNLDGVLDVATLAAGASTSVYQIFFGQDPTGQLAFVPSEPRPTGLSGRGSVLAVGDMTGDGFPDLALTTEDTGFGRLFLSDSDCPVATILAGDANGDGRLDISDPTTLLLYLFSGGGLPCRRAADANGDANLNIADAVHILTYLFDGGPAPVASRATSCDGGQVR